MKGFKKEGVESTPSEVSLKKPMITQRLQVRLRERQPHRR